MKKIIALVLTLALCFSLAACGSSSSEETVPESKSGESTETVSKSEKESETTGEKESILYYCPQIGDFGLFDMGWRSAQAAAEKYDMDLTLVEFGADTSQAINSLVDALDGKHYDYVICIAWVISDTIIEKSRSGEWADTTFILYDMARSVDTSGTDNIYGISFAQNEGSFLAGVYSALMTKTGKIGAVINQDTPIVNDFAAGWLCGYKYAVNEMDLDVEMMLTYMGELSVQSDYESVNVVLDNGCDYIYNVGGTYALGAMQAAEEKGGIEGGKYIIGVDYDQYEYFEKVGDVVGYKTMVTSMLKNIETCVALIFEDIKTGTNEIEPGNKLYGVAEGGTGLAENDWYKENTPQEVQDTIHELAEKIGSGEIKVVSYFDFDSYDAFATYRDNPEAEFAA